MERVRAWVRVRVVGRVGRAIWIGSRGRCWGTKGASFFLIVFSFFPFHTLHHTPSRFPVSGLTALQVQEHPGARDDLRRAPPAGLVPDPPREPPQCRPRRAPVLRARPRRPPRWKGASSLPPLISGVALISTLTPWPRRASSTPSPRPAAAQRRRRRAPRRQRSRRSSPPRGDFRARARARPQRRLPRPSTRAAARAGRNGNANGNASASRRRWWGRGGGRCLRRRCRMRGCGGRGWVRLGSCLVMGAGVGRGKARGNGEEAGRWGGEGGRRWR